jgi:hypothetical protein
MQGPDLIYVVMPVVILLALFVLIALPFAGTRGSNTSRAGGRHASRQQTQGQIQDQSIAPDASGSDMIGLGHAQRFVTARGHVPGVETTASSGTGDHANARRITSQPTGGRSNVP